MKRKPKIIHAEILCYAARQILNEVSYWLEKCDGDPKAAYPFIKPLGKKLKAIKEMYRFETGTEIEYYADYFKSDYEYLTKQFFDIYN